MIEKPATARTLLSQAFFPARRAPAGKRVWPARLFILSARDMIMNQPTTFNHINVKDVDFNETYSFERHANPCAMQHLMIKRD